MTKRTLLAIRQIGLEDLGSFEHPFRMAGYDIEYVDVADQDVGHLDPLSADMIVVLGGPIGVYDHEAYPIVNREIELLRTRLAADRPTLGICLGAQLMAAALGARVYSGPAKEIGWSPLELTEARPSRRLLAARLDSDLPQSSLRPRTVYTWPAVPSEVLSERFEHWLLGHASEIAAAGISPSTLRRDTTKFGESLETAAARFLTDWIGKLVARP